MATTAQLMTALELLALPDDGQRHELIAGELTTVPPPGDEHGGIIAAVTESLRGHVRAHKLGVVRAGETGFLLTTNPDTVRAADVAFISRARLTEPGPVRGYRRGAPDLALEIISPTDRYTEVEEKVVAWFAAGARMVVTVNPRRRTVAVYRAPTRVRILTVADLLDGEDVVPGWRMPVAAIFEDDGV